MLDSTLQTVHTTGVNWDGIVVNTGVITTTVSVIGAVIVRRIKKNFSESVQDIVNKALVPIVDKLNDHSEKIAYLLGMQEGKRLLVGETNIGPRTERRIPTEKQSTSYPQPDPQAVDNDNPS